MVFSHAHNTFDKRRLLQENFNPQFTKESNKTIAMFIKEPDMRDFYLNQIEELLKPYEQGRSYMKPDVIKQMVEMEKSRKIEMDKFQQQQQIQPTITLKQGDGPPQQLTMDQVVSVLQQQQAQIIHLTNLLQGKDMEIKILQDSISSRRI